MEDEGEDFDTNDHYVHLHVHLQVYALHMPAVCTYAQLFSDAPGTVHVRDGDGDDHRLDLILGMLRSMVVRCCVQCPRIAQTTFRGGGGASFAKREEEKARSNFEITLISHDLMI